ncbi:YlcI/YnfO family protein [Acetivibrio sp. MSJd-27]|jgi:hypothetical protein|uniref:YlcI/YnfO family protein n=1 Tax=Acetivibrio sp. MSJd-27 TaxID=2841523 RepID=UPI0015AE135B|nr:YlcI/YnfO family protein [Acetivibrio sp. MSJd-27]MBU5451412.1 hypothetical protein [Acetivibrio sp. MSJd-27]
MRKFKIPAIPKKTNKTIRFPDTVIEKVEENIRGTDCTFSAFIVAGTEFTLEMLEEEKKEKGSEEIHSHRKS